MTIDTKKLRDLAHNLAIGAALCRAWETGCDFGSRESDIVNSSVTIESENRALAELWRPGCGRGAP
jgi:hypothetical protein